MKGKERKKIILRKCYISELNFENILEMEIIVVELFFIFPLSLIMTAGESIKRFILFLYV